MKKELILVVAVIVIAMVVAIATAKPEPVITAISKKMEGSYDFTVQVFFAETSYPMEFWSYVKGDTISLGDSAFVALVAPVQKSMINDHPTWKFSTKRNNLLGEDEMILQLNKAKIISIKKHYSDHSF